MPICPPYINLPTIYNGDSLSPNAIKSGTFLFLFFLDVLDLFLFFGHSLDEAVFPEALHDGGPFDEAETAA